MIRAPRHGRPGGKGAGGGTADMRLPDPMLLQPHTMPAVIRYSVAIAVTVTALIADLVVSGRGGVSPFPLVLLAILFSAWYGGLGPALLATGLGVPTADFLFEAPRYTLHLMRAESLLQSRRHRHWLGRQ